jgi:hypothetical protein
MSSPTQRRHSSANRFARDTSDHLLRNARPPWAPTLPFNPQDIGTSRWQLAIERYTNLLASERGPDGVFDSLGVGADPPKRSPAIPEALRRQRRWTAMRVPNLIILAGTIAPAGPRC